MSVTEYRDLITARSAAYAEEVEQIRFIHLSELDRAVDDLMAEEAGDSLAAAVVEETAERSALLVATIADSVRRYAVDLSELDVPGAVRPAHDELVDALQLSISEVGVTVDALNAATSFDEIDAAIGGSMFNDTQPRVDAACAALEQALADAGAPGDLRCIED